MVKIHESPQEIRRILHQCSSRRKAIQWFLNSIIHDLKPNCSKCRIPMSVNREGGIPTRWRCSRCRHSFGIFHNTVFEGKHAPFHKSLLALLLIYLHVPQSTIRFLCHLSRTTILFYQTLYRKISVSVVRSMHLLLGGPHIRIQIDEALLRKRKYHRGRKKVQIWIFGAVQEGPRNKQQLVLKRVRHRSAEILLPLIRTIIKPGSIIISDDWRAYRRLKDLGYEHKIVNHSIQFRNHDGDNTNLIEGIWAHLRRSFPTSGVKKHLVDQYLARFTYNEI